MFSWGKRADPLSVPLKKEWGSAGTAHDTELQLADTKGEGDVTCDRNSGTEIRARACSSDRIFLSSILLSKLLLLPSSVPSAPSAAKLPAPAVEPWGRRSEPPSFFAIPVPFFAAKTGPALLRFPAGCFCRSFLGGSGGLCMMILASRPSF